MKILTTTHAAVAFAAFAAFAYFKPKTAAAAAPGAPLQYDPFGTIANQHALVQAAAASQNLDYLNSPNFLAVPGQLYP